MWEHDDIIVLTLEVLHRNETNNGNLNKNQNNTFILLKNYSYRASPLLRLGASVDVSRCRHWPNIQPAQKERCRWHLQFLSYTHTLGHTNKTQLINKQTNKLRQGPPGTCSNARYEIESLRTWRLPARDRLSGTWPTRSSSLAPAMFKWHTHTHTHIWAHKSTAYIKQNNSETCTSSYVTQQVSLVWKTIAAKLTQTTPRRLLKKQQRLRPRTFSQQTTTFVENKQRTENNQNKCQENNRTHNYSTRHVHTPTNHSMRRWRDVNDSTADFNVFNLKHNTIETHSFIIAALHMYTWHAHMLTYTHTCGHTTA